MKKKPDLHDVVFVIVNYNSCSNTHKIIKKLSPHFSNLFVFDNSCNYEAAQEEVVIRDDFGRNIGFGRAINEVIFSRNVHSEYLFLINPDVIFDLLAVKELIEYMKYNSSCGISFPLTVNDRDVKIAPFRQEVGILWEIKTTSRRYKKSLLGSFDLSKSPMNVRFFDASFAIVRLNIFRLIGGFNQEVFMYGEDLLFSKSVREQGYSIDLHCNIRICHYGGASFQADVLGKFKRLIVSSYGLAVSTVIIKSLPAQLKYFYAFIYIFLFGVKNIFRSNNNVRISEDNTLLL